jgi:hypothetical protein
MNFRRLIDMLSVVVMLNISVVAHSTVAQRSRCESAFIESLPQKGNFADFLGVDYNEALQRIQREQPELRDIQRELRATGLSAKKVTGISDFLKKYKYHSDYQDVLNEFMVESRIAAFINRHFEELYSTQTSLNSSVQSADIPDYLAHRRPGGNDLSRNLADAADRLALAKDLDYAALTVSGLRPRDLFVQSHAKEVRRIDGVEIFTRIEIIKWLQSPMAKISTVKQMTALLTSMKELKAYFIPDPLIGWRSCEIFNPQAQQALAKLNLFLVKENKMARLNSRVNHTFLRYYPANGNTPIIIDFSFNQMVRTRDDGLYIGTHDSLNRELRLNGGIDKIWLYDTVERDRNQSAIGVNTNSIRKIRKQLEHARGVSSD